METILFNVQKQKITTFRDSFVSTTIGAYKCKFVFDCEWDGLQKTAVFIRDDKEPVQMLLDANNECPFADELIQCDGNISIGVYGTKDGVRYPTIKTKMLVIMKGVSSGAIPTPPTPSVYEQLLAQFNNLTLALEHEVERAESKENELAESIENEIQRATERENEIEAKIPSITHLATKEELNAEVQARTQAIEQEQASRQAKDNELEQSIANEVTRAKEAEKALNDSKQNNIADLETIRQGASKGATAVQDANYVHTDNNFTTQEKQKLAGLENYNDTEIRQAIQDVASDVAELEAEVDKKLLRVVLYLSQVDNVWTLKDAQGGSVTFQNLHDLIKDESNYVVVLVGNSKLRPQYVSTSEIHCDGEDRDSQGSLFMRMIMTSTNLYYQTFRQAEASDLVSKANVGLDNINEDGENKIKEVIDLDTRLEPYYTKIEVDTELAKKQNVIRDLETIRQYTNMFKELGLIVENGYICQE